MRGRESDKRGQRVHGFAQVRVRLPFLNAHPGPGAAALGGRKRRVRVHLTISSVQPAFEGVVDEPSSSSSSLLRQWLVRGVGARGQWGNVATAATTYRVESHWAERAPPGKVVGGRAGGLGSDARARRDATDGRHDGEERRFNADRRIPGRRRTGISIDVVLIHGDDDDEGATG